MKVNSRGYPEFRSGHDGRAKGAYPGLRIRVTGFRTSEPYAGPLCQFIAEPARFEDVVRALRPFEGDYTGMKL